MSEPVVVDTNILVRAFLSGKMEEDEILKHAISGGRRLVYGRDQLVELAEVLGYERITKKYRVEAEELEKLGRWVMEKEEIEPEEINLCQDPDDNYVIGLVKRAARRSKAYLVTGDKHILKLKGKIEGVEIMRPGEFF